MIDDSAYHGDLSFSVALSNPGGATLGNPPAPTSSSTRRRRWPTWRSMARLIPTRSPAAGKSPSATACTTTAPAARHVDQRRRERHDLRLERNQRLRRGRRRRRNPPGGGFTRRTRPEQARSPLTASCTTPNPGETGPIHCTWDVVDPYQSASVQIVLNVTAPYGTVFSSASVASDLFDPQPDNNATTLDVTVSSDVYVAASGDCGGNLPCWLAARGLNHVGEGKTAFVAGGTYPEDVSLYTSAVVQLSDDVTITGSLFIYNGTFVATPAR
ncbi:MAG: hypothetical protein HZY76_00505 [Anaerolineae bacterium]|nr:MAG: hypothetical protein HZY76_00505 [Anaerolineae bacterium]